MIIKEHSGIKFVELFVGMGKMVSWWHQYALGFQLRGQRIYQGVHGKEITYWMQQGNANLLITSALEPAAHDVVSFVDRHGNSIKRFAVEVNNIEETLAHLKAQKAIFLSDIVLIKNRYAISYTCYRNFAFNNLCMRALEQFIRHHSQL